MNVAIVTNVIPNYRRAFYEHLDRQTELKYSIFCQSHLPKFNLSLIHDELSCPVILVPFLGNETALVWQWLPIWQLWKRFDAYVFYGNPRLVSTVVWATLFRLLGKRVVIWGQGHSARAGLLTEKLRLAWWSCFDRILVYTDREARSLLSRGFEGKCVVGINNGLDQQEIEAAAAQWDPERLAFWQRARGLCNRPVMLSVARLVAEKRFGFVVRALPALLEKVPDLVWCVIGDGPARSDLEKQAENLGVDDHIRWLGAIYEESTLAPWFLSSDVLVHPGAIGLTLLHAFGYGVPVVTHDCVEHHWPEIAAFEQGVTGLLFEKGSVDSFCMAVESLIGNPALRSRLGHEARRVARTQYNVDVMTQRFLKAVDSGCTREI